MELIELIIKRGGDAFGPGIAAVDNNATIEQLCGAEARRGRLVVVPSFSRAGAHQPANLLGLRSNARAGTANAQTTQNSNHPTSLQ